MKGLIFVSMLLLLNACKKSDVSPENNFLGTWQSVKYSVHYTSNGQSIDVKDKSLLGWSYLFEKNNKVTETGDGTVNSATYEINTSNNTIKLTFGVGEYEVYDYEFISSSELRLARSNAEFMRINENPNITSGTQSITYKKL